MTNSGSFQKTVDTMLIRHQSILDILAKNQEASARVTRAVTKAVTSCGCLAIEAHKESIPETATISDLKGLLSSHVAGTLCPSCHEIIETELGRQMFYIAALANTLNLSLDEAVKREENMLKTLTVFTLR
ncbi:MAG: DUF1573 domain-containing protein [Peptococcaceae bacterium]|nr:DUF1573 domain-containing protein [Peptococcaceae bacterium]